MNSRVVLYSVTLVLVFCDTKKVFSLLDCIIDSPATSITNFVFRIPYSHLPQHGGLCEVWSNLLITHRFKAIHNQCFILNKIFSM
ncbi:hypothetical protein GLOIN_2v1656830 [Rhizophagus irregularis DAOM 181602=DAOM 197198]|uniref:Uncharacterized protein n=1 Tax=Rhizophagus irregularis (strain DAOM 181602 / DAOM 197198 / MUCL 43194) TaxID=747089 RepID=A0A2P4PM85_RHIID|nr:hypothetical protein GLOIN_2v1656830 [Rhizophagus irregularis DAOM 181602=DAOM 197198]POG66502.1 hypothetical protein GLOIN_2v1656830 [Rhizophagus irregularis DAOM 181602=DAOM 197198]|eukprot:XP_025173368.1 hypothetical protein GLOIN_2v1656830 [Rhizophagus irregularis DAOM 181602=DAOM 197198]